MGSQGKRYKFRVDGSWLAVLLWMVLLFLFSAQEAGASSRLSGGLLHWVYGILTRIGPEMEWNRDVLHILLRKSAHFTVYAVLGFLVQRALHRSGVSHRRSWWIALLFCFLYAASDEVHQCFVAGRAGQLADIFLDSVGSCFGIGTWRSFARKVAHR